MKLEKELEEYKMQTVSMVREDRVLEVIQKSKEVFILQEQRRTLGHSEFMLEQLRLMRKRWWFLQMILLGIGAVILPNMHNKTSTVRILGVLGVLFIVLIIPEFWKNKSCDCMQVEGTCLYSLRQIYAVRMLLFALVDTFIIACFCMGVSGNVSLATGELLVQFLFPMLVAACICFGTLCSSRAMNEGMAIFFCLLWSAVWCVLLVNETVYAAITVPVWYTLFGVCLAFLSGAVYKTIHDCNKYWEVDIRGTTIG